jgi:uncharacterized protein (TIGR00725 family)
MMSYPFQDPDLLWGNLLSQQPELVKSTFALLSGEEQKTVLDHLEEMSEKEGWLPSQRLSASIALQVLRENLLMTSNHAIQIVTVFGGSTPGSQGYQDAVELGEMLAKQGFVVQTGGYIGTMEGVSRGASQAGGHVIGITCDEIENWRKVKPNAWVKEERRFPTIRERLYALIESCDAALALPGGIGTLTEISLMWNLLLTEAIAPRPLIIIGQGWKSVFDLFIATSAEYVPVSQRRWASFADNNAAALDKLLNPGQM